MTELIGTPSQIEWAEKIRVTVGREFDRVTSAFNAQMERQSPAKQAETRVYITILEEKRAETLANSQAGYFIQNWQELSDQVRQLIAKDPRYLQIRNQKKDTDG